MLDLTSLPLQRQLLYLEGLNHPFLTFLTSQVFLTYCQQWSEHRVYEGKDSPFFTFLHLVTESKNALEHKGKSFVEKNHIGPVNIFFLHYVNCPK